LLIGSKFAIDFNEEFAKNCKPLIVSKTQNAFFTMVKKKNRAELLMIAKGRYDEGNDQREFKADNSRD